MASSENKVFISYFYFIFVLHKLIKIIIFSTSSSNKISQIHPHPSLLTRAWKLIMTMIYKKLKDQLQTKNKYNEIPGKATQNNCSEKSSRLESKQSLFQHGGILIKRGFLSSTYITQKTYSAKSMQV